MKKTTLLLALPLLLAGPAVAQKISVSFVFKSIEVGYDHQTRCALFVDGQEVAASPTVPQSKGGKFSVKVAPGRHTLRVVNYALYEGKWEEHTVENSYSQDCLWEGTAELGKKKCKLKIALVFDLDRGTAATFSGKNFEFL